MNSLVAHEVQTDQLPAPANDSAALMSVISRAASDPACDIEKMERLMAMHERMTERQAAVAYATALVDLQCVLPAIAERGGITNKQGGIQSTYALWEDTNEVLKPLLKAHGFALTFRIATVNGRIAVTGVLTHRAGHSEQTTFDLPTDDTGGKNTVQANGSSVSYGKRYTAGALLNLTSYGEDDDGFRAGGTVDQKAEDWIRVAQSLQTPAEYNDERKRMKADYGDDTAQIPPSVVTAFNKARAAVMPKD